MAIKKILRLVRRYKVIASHYYYDASRFVRSSTLRRAGLTEGNLDSRIIAHAHCIEKGLSLPEPRYGFGKDMIQSLFGLLELYRGRSYSEDSTCMQMAMGALDAYVKYHEDNGQLNVISEIVEQYQQVRDFPDSCGGVDYYSKSDISKYFSGAFSDLAAARKSIREYSPEPVSMETIKEAARVAQLTPSVCNRQGSRLHVLEGGLKCEALQFQNGNRGFGEQIDKILVVTASQSIFSTVAERNQAYVDGGMFAMSLLYALTERGIATCCLNWSAPIKNDRSLRELGFIPDDEVVIMFIAVGNYKESFRVARSLRKPVDEVFFVHN